MKVQCDQPTCNFVEAVEGKSLAEFTTNLERDWLDTPCPVCGKGVIVNEAELEMAKMLAMFEGAGLAQVNDGEPDMDNPVRVGLNLAALRPESDETELMKVHIVKRDPKDLN